ncbi:MAG: NAD(P)-dependent malic enzyme [Betaproteobacteria bacterium]
MDLKEQALELHSTYRGKVEVTSKVPLKNRQDLSLAYTPGVAEPCRVIARNPDAVYEYTAKGNLVAVVSDGTAVLGLGNIGAKAALPVMEGKAVLFKAFAGVDAFPICIDSQDPDVIVEVVSNLSPTFGGINLEDIAAPNCFYIERRLKERLDIPVFHDDQHGTAVVVFAGLTNALKVVGKRLQDVRIVMNGAGAAGIAVCKLLLAAGAGEVTLCDRKGVIYAGRPHGMNAAKEEIAAVTNPRGIKGSLTDAIAGADVFIGVSSASVLNSEMVRSMNDRAIIFALANPDPEILPDDAKAAGAAVVATGRSDYPNQINNVLGFPGIFRGALDMRATDINEAMKIAAAEAIAGLIERQDLRADYVIPAPLDPRVAPAVAAAVARAAMESGVARVEMNPESVAERCRSLASI